MDFILGILTGIGLALFAGHYLNERVRKRRAKQAENTQKKIIDAHINWLWSITPPPYPVMTLEQRLKEAIEENNFEEAARLRDLINKR